VPRLHTVRQVQEEDAAGARVRPPKGDTQVAPFFHFFVLQHSDMRLKIYQEIFFILNIFFNTDVLYNLYDCYFEEPVENGFEKEHILKIN
jgi:hypothetical protein